MSHAGLRAASWVSVVAIRIRKIVEPERRQKTEFQLDG